MVWKNLTGLHKSTPGPVHFCSLTFLRIITFAQGHCHAGTKHLKQKINLKMLQQSQKREVIVYILIDKIVGEYTLFLKQQVNSALKKKHSKDCETKENTAQAYCTLRSVSDRCRCGITGRGPALSRSLLQTLLFQVILFDPFRSPYISVL